MHVTSSIHDLASSPARSPNLEQRYLDVRRMSIELCRPLGVEDHSLQAMPDASPAKWHLAHTTWFFETFLLNDHLPGYRSFHPAFRTLFNSYYNSVGDRPLRTMRHVLSRPSLEEVHAYRRAIDEAMLRLLAQDLSPAMANLVLLGLNHEQQHQELIVTDVKYGLYANPLRPAYRDSASWQSAAQAPRSVSSRPALQWHSVAEGLYAIGHDGTTFYFDNEGPRHETFLQPFRLASRLVTNSEYLEFIGDGGYSTATLWLSDGWDCVRTNSWNAPLYWEQRDGDWWQYTMDGMQPVEMDAPVCHVSYYEADAFAHWAGARLPNEFEWEVAANTSPVAGNFLESSRLHPQPVEPGTALSQMFGDVWEWTGSAYLPYSGFKPPAGAVGEYNGKFMCNQMVLRGGSCATPASHIRASYRNFFPPHVRWQFMGLRLANGE